MGRFPSRGAQEDSGMRESHGKCVKRADAYNYNSDDNDDDYDYKASSEYAFDR